MASKNREYYQWKWVHCSVATTSFSNTNSCCWREVQQKWRQVVSERRPLRCCATVRIASLVEDASPANASARSGTQCLCPRLAWRQRTPEDSLARRTSQHSPTPEKTSKKPNLLCCLGKSCVQGEICCCAAAATWIIFSNTGRWGWGMCHRMSTHLAPYHNAGWGMMLLILHFTWVWPWVLAKGLGKDSDAPALLGLQWSESFASSCTRV